MTSAQPKFNKLNFFRRSVPLSVEVLADQASATYKNGVLRVELPKAEPAPPRSVNVPVE